MQSSVAFESHRTSRDHRLVRGNVIVRELNVAGSDELVRNFADLAAVRVAILRLTPPRLDP